MQQEVVPDGLPGQPWALSPQAVLEALEVSADKGLGPAGVRSRRERFGPNRLREAPTKSVWLILADQFKSLMVVLLSAALALSFAFGDWVEGLAIGVVIVLNAAIGFVMELQAVRSMEALYGLSRVEAKVRREGEVQQLLADQLVPGDIVLMEGGDIASADLRLIEASKLQADESSLTGESFPVTKQAKALEAELPLTERSNMLYSGTAVTRGSAEGVVVATGMLTELGRITALVAEAEPERTPLERRLDKLSRKLIWVTLAIAPLIATMGILAGKEFFLMIETGIALAVAAVPEGMPIVATIALARGMGRMARHNALINRLSAVETLGATTIICTDKTGTLTESRMTVSCIVVDLCDVAVSGEGLSMEGDFRRAGEPVDPSSEPVLREALEVGVLCNNASLKTEMTEGEGLAVGDPLEVALLVAAAKAGLTRSAMLDALPEVLEEAFDPDLRLMATVHKDGDSYRVAVKGAPEAVLDACTHIRTAEGDREMADGERSRWHELNQRLADEGLRVLAVATKWSEAAEDDPYQGLSMVGFVGFLDPPRVDVRPAIDVCRQAGIRVVMVTGDQPTTAWTVARAVGLVDEMEEVEVIHGRNLGRLEDLSGRERQRLLHSNIFARVTPEQKLDLIALHQGQEAIVAMTGDGVNDAPALKKADIGVAMGLRGTQVAQEAADMVLKDDAFSTIVAAVEHGRVIFNNIRKFVLYLLSCNVSEVMIVSLAAAVNAPLPILPLQILFLNLVTDVFPALALGMGGGEPAVMRRPPRDPHEPILARRHWLSIGGYGATITLSVLGALGLALVWFGMDKRQAVSISFLTLAFAQLWHVFNMRERGSNLFSNEITRNVFVWGALALCVSLLVLAVYLPVLSTVLKVVNPGAKGWALVVGMSLIPFTIGQLRK
jgi:Ca2+-transporting ATPase